MISKTDLKDSIGFGLIKLKGLIFSILFSKYLYPAVTLLSAGFIIFLIHLLKPFIEFGNVSLMIEFLSVTSVLFIVMGLAGLAQAVYPYGIRTGLDKIFNGFCIMCTVCSITYSLEYIFRVADSKTVFLIVGAVCVLFGFLYALKEKIKPSELWYDDEDELNKGE